MSTLVALQTALQQRVLCGDPSIEGSVAGDAREVATRLGIYEYAYRARLTEALGVTYPVLRKLLGVAAFEAAAATYIAGAVPTHASIRWYGADLHRHLRGMHADLARWEWLLAEVFDAGDDFAMTEADIARVAPADWPALRLRWHRTVRRFEATTNAVECWQAVSEDRPCPEPRATAPVSWVVWRRDPAIRFRSTTPAEGRALARLAGGASFAALCAGLAQETGERDAARCAATMLKGWIGEGLLGR
ncbi:MAG TPA: putative DNA-binding domain-containing protein [Steroidobacteraceae bacterium]|nr:putative DNA-binding domain-containing protein [Steroidobacteraceae bacterium]HNS27578.1 putative DNA-binding domain-containing protein [Steroidobacteraceae bacterium]